MRRLEELIQSDITQSEGSGFGTAYQDRYYEHGTNDGEAIVHIAFEHSTGTGEREKKS